MADGKKLSTIQTTCVIPADLNAFLYRMESNVARFAEALGDTSTAAAFQQHAAARCDAIQQLMWDASTGKLGRYLHAEAVPYVLGRY